MKSIALRFSENFAPSEGTIAEHRKLIKQCGFVYWGKLGSQVSKTNRNLVLSEPSPKILLIHSGETKRYWAHIEDITYERPPYDEFPAYYHSLADKIKTWFKIISIDEAPKDVLSKCKVVSSGIQLGIVSKHSMSPYYVIEFAENSEEG